MVSCPICEKAVTERNINAHIDSGCEKYVEDDASSAAAATASAAPPSSTAPPLSSFFKTPVTKRETNHAASQPISSPIDTTFQKSLKRSFDESTPQPVSNGIAIPEPLAKKSKPNAFQKAAPLAERMRPTTLDEVYGQELVGPTGVLRGLIETDRVPSMILWGNAGTGKTTIARVIANMVGSRFVEINSTSSGVAECKKIFAEAKSELGLTGRKTIIFCDEIHRFSKSQQDVFLGPVEAGHVTLIGATTENPSFKVQNALLSRCRTFTLAKLTDEDIMNILKRALESSRETYHPGPLVNDELLHYLASFSDGDARTSLNLLELAMDLSKRPRMTIENLKSSLTKTLVYDRSGDQHYDTISAFHKSVRGSDPNAALYYLARMIQSGEDALYIARRMVVMASEDVGLADNSLLPLAIATYTAAEKIGLPEARINLAHCAVALSLAPKSTRSYRGYEAAVAALHEPGIAGLPIPIHLRNAPTRLMKELGYGKEYKYNPNYWKGKVKQDYLPEKLLGREFLEDLALGTERDPEVEYSDDDDESPAPAASAAPTEMVDTSSSEDRKRVINFDADAEVDGDIEHSTSFKTSEGTINLSQEEEDDDDSGKRPSATPIAQSAHSTQTTRIVPVDELASDEKQTDTDDHNVESKVIDPTISRIDDGENDESGRHEAGGGIDNDEDEQEFYIEHE